MDNTIAAWHYNNKQVIVKWWADQQKLHTKHLDIPFERRKEKQSQLKTWCPNVSCAYRVEPHHPEDPDGEGKVDHQDDNEQQHKQVETALPPAIDANLVEFVGHRPGRAAALGGGDILFPHHLSPGCHRWRQVHRQWSKIKDISKDIEDQFEMNLAEQRELLKQPVNIMLIISSEPLKKANSVL